MKAVPTVTITDSGSSNGTYLDPVLRKGSVRIARGTAYAVRPNHPFHVGAVLCEILLRGAAPTGSQDAASGHGGTQPLDLMGEDEAAGRKDKGPGGDASSGEQEGFAASRDESTRVLAGLASPPKTDAPAPAFGAMLPPVTPGGGAAATAASHSAAVK